MGFARSYLISFFICVSVLNEIGLLSVTCQDEEGSQCLPKKTFLALLRLPEVSSNLAAYSRTARISQDAKGRNDIVHLKALSTEEGDDAEICIPGGVYLELFRDPAMRGHLGALGRTQKVLEYPGGRVLEESEEVDAKDMIPEAEKRNIAALIKNDDLPLSIKARAEMEQEEEEERARAEEEEAEEERQNSALPRYNPAVNTEALDALVRALAVEEAGRSLPSSLRGYALVNGDTDPDPFARDYPVDKRNVGSLAREYALPLGRRNIASLARDYGLPAGKDKEYWGKRNIGALARDYMLPTSGKRNVASLARVYMLPQAGKRNIAALARSYSLPYDKRYLGSLARTGDMPSRGSDDDKRSIASLARNAEHSGFAKRSLSRPPGGLILRTLSRHGRSLNDQQQGALKDDSVHLRTLTRDDSSSRTGDIGKDVVQGGASVQAPRALNEPIEESQSKNRSSRRTSPDERRTKRQISEYSDEYPLPVMQNANTLDYEEMIEALTGQYPNAEKRFMGRIPQMGPRPTTPPTRRRRLGR